MDKEFIVKLNSFIGEASLKTYAGGGAEIRPSEVGFHELEHRDGDLYYKDSYGGHFQSWGRETVWYKNELIWSSYYGGGMEKEYHGNEEFTHQTFSFLKKAMSAGEKQKEFQPRGPSKYEDGDWRYQVTWNGDIAKFLGHEDILYRDKVVFTHDFFGGFYI
ncbi:hypothetical protein A3I46_00195 [Candidatus Kaiserbacteria bacterium RIFCSPLOWO2_02_FULL_54_13]|uniref:DUF5680 domain-containing protein n=1 Tax=Candidatus Kaiserbacteria bacterium RIFCSPHIGHO2_02_FULL_54_22 TaxID=1798495 RepID=A0A1F6DMJ7_9BACT|nr:MAG: hypothetical protein UY89_C0013G0005 [Parcubacteria group bacterium GW2011_GWA1_54_9]KKW41782.1 MAG: hypothetical protein UY91_C0011G0006 [Parcubacteria group bacterium GW2011_GWB1_55_9]OGG62655.1 MAG: hypothetical protein A3C19_02740 [Candidatus Kaiserbacteria bacterium RIFCSPHIGHO2_02_FULL_54_22]OGG68233.1 MAG: hypothetical protein A3E99_00745 [Candidatus Kaiserbacteria bacterium RIFCSPHIGHO2_12_FULL_54_16]OGG82826.1 MAG: hypothetical protein A3I46_00195 [Candidatus Kaiserbacteria bac